MSYFTPMQLPRMFFGCLLLAIVIALSGCGDTAGSNGAGAGYGPSGTQVLVPATANESTIGMSTTNITPKVPGEPDAEMGGGDAEYGIGPGDVLEISVFDVADLKTKVQVNSDGTILFPLIGTIHVVGKSTTEAAGEIANRLQAKYLQSAQVSVLVSHSAQRVSVNGAVQRPGVITLDGTLTLSQAVAEAGGASDVADEKRVHIAHLQRDQTVKDMVYSLKDIQKGMALDPKLRSGDIVVVEESGMRRAYKTVLEILPVIGSIATATMMGAGL
jgi:polysaccharide biosynthesis/export protein